MEHIWSVLCQAASIDKDSNTISLFQVLEGINIGLSADPDVEQQPVALPISMVLVTLWWRDEDKDEERGVQRIRLKSPKGKYLDIGKAEVEVRLEGNITQFRTRMNFPGFPYAGEGKYRFIVQYRTEPNARWRNVASIPLNINREIVTEHQ